MAATHVTADRLVVGNWVNDFFMSLNRQPLLRSHGLGSQHEVQTRRDTQLLDHVRGPADGYAIGLARAFVRKKIDDPVWQAATAEQQLAAHRERVLRWQLREAALGLTNSHAPATAVRMADSFPSTPTRLLE